MKPEESKPNDVLRGPLFPEPVQVLITTPMGSAAKMLGKLRAFSSSQVQKMKRTDGGFVRVDNQSRFGVMLMECGSTRIYLLPAPHAERPGRGYFLASHRGT